MTPTLYFAKGSCAFPCLVALEEAGAPFRAVALDLAAGEQTTSTYLAINPRGRVPALTVGAATITESAAIICFIADSYPQADLLPTEPLARARALELLSWFVSTIQVTFSQFFRPARFSEEELVQAQLKRDAAPRARQLLDELDSLLTGAWLLGDGYSAPDPYLMVFWRWAEDRLGIEMTPYSRLAAHRKRLLARPAVQAALAREAAPKGGRAGLTPVPSPRMRKTQHPGAMLD